MSGLGEISLLLVFIALCAVAIKLARIPGEIAAKRNHPNKDAIKLLGQLGVLTFGVLWIAALVWAYSNVASTATFQASGRSPQHPSGPAAVPPAVNVADEIEKLARLRDQGILTEAEFTARKRTVLGA